MVESDTHQAARPITAKLRRNLGNFAHPARPIIAEDAFDQDWKAILEEATQVVAVTAEVPINELTLVSNRSVAVVENVEEVLTGQRHSLLLQRKSRSAVTCLVLKLFYKHSADFTSILPNYTAPEPDYFQPAEVAEDRQHAHSCCALCSTS